MQALAEDRTAVGSMQALAEDNLAKGVIQKSRPVTRITPPFEKSPEQIRYTNAHHTSLNIYSADIGNTFTCHILFE